MNRPCPSCGSLKIFVSSYDFRTPETQDIVCMDCTIGVSGDKKFNSYDVWNKRESDKELTALRAVADAAEKLTNCYYQFTERASVGMDSRGFWNMMQKYCDEYGTTKLALAAWREMKK